MVRIRAVTYAPISDELSGNSALVQAANTLDVAVSLAVDSKNVDKLLDIAAMWIGLAERLGVEGEEEESDSEETVNEKPVFGFTSMSKIEEPTKEVVAEDA